MRSIPAGAAVIGWVRVAGGTVGDVVSRPAGGTFGATSTVASGYLRPVQARVHQLRVAIDVTGRASAAWTTSSAWATSQRADGTWVTATGYPNSGRVAELDLSIDSTGTAQLLWSDGGQLQAVALPPGGGWGKASPVLPGSAPFSLTLAPNGAQVFAGWFDSASTAVNVGVHTAPGWGNVTRVATLSAGTWVAAVATAPVGTGALVAWLAGSSSGSYVAVSTS